jgi:hypothetical protein
MTLDLTVSGAITLARNSLEAAFVEEGTWDGYFVKLKRFNFTDTHLRS